MFDKLLEKTKKVFEVDKDKSNEELTEDINKERVTRWEELFVPYDELTEEMQEEDRKWARKVLNIL